MIDNMKKFDHIKFLTGKEKNIESEWDIKCLWSNKVYKNLRKRD